MAIATSRAHWDNAVVGYYSGSQSCLVRKGWNLAVSGTRLGKHLRRGKGSHSVRSSGYTIRMVKRIEILGTVESLHAGVRVPMFAAAVAAGFPSPADDYVERALDLNEHLIEHPAATYCVRASGNSMVGTGIHDGDLLIVDRAIEPRDGSIAIAVIDGELTVKRIRRHGERLLLVPANSDYPYVIISAVP